MNMQGCVIFLEPDQAETFFQESLKPDIEALRRRDVFLDSLEKELLWHTDGLDLVAEIPDIDLPSVNSLEYKGVSILQSIAWNVTVGSNLGNIEYEPKCGIKNTVCVPLDNTSGEFVANQATSFAA